MMLMFNQALASIEQKYNVLGVIDADNMQSPNGKHWLHCELQKLHQPVFKNNDRIVVIQKNPDIYEYTDLPGQFISTLQKFVSEIDISNYFVLLVTFNPNIKQELQQAKMLYSTDKNPIQHEIVAGSEYVPVQQKKDTFCILPWMALYVGPDGNVLPCCVADQKFPLGNIKQASVDSIAKSDQSNVLRGNMLSGQRSKECQYCYIREDARLSSPRLQHNKRWRNKVEFANTNVLNQFAPVYLDLRLNTVCNLKCRMCSGYFSSAIAQEEVDLFKDYRHKHTSLPSYSRKLLINDLIKYVPQAEKIYFAGGEPLLAAEHYNILDELIRSGNTNVEISYNTNFTNISYKNQPISNWWNQFKNITVGASIDAMGEVIEYVRHGTVWANIEENLKILQDQCVHVNFTVTSTVGFLTANSLINLQKKWHTTKKLDITKFTLSPTVSPAHLTISALPQHHKIRLGNIIQSHINWCKDHSADALAQQWQDVLQYMWHTDGSHHLVEFSRLTQIMDKHRGECFAKTFPEFKDLI
jgi:radical SAM protein with 4Fe4S-binding SPASM domain